MKKILNTTIGDCPKMKPKQDRWRMRARGPVYTLPA